MTESEVWAKAEELAFEKWPEQTVLDEPDLIEAELDNARDALGGAPA